jgi:tRNA(fMet)-specific endonuclease VapC
MILLDTDHLSIVTNPRAAGHEVLFNRLNKCTEALAVPVICVEEQCKGWLAKIHHARGAHRQIPGYQRLIELFQFFREWEITAFDSAAADVFDRFQAQKIRIGSQDLKIAAIAVVNDALLLSANLRDFRQVPDLRVENWLEA